MKLSNLTETQTEKQYPENWPPQEYFIHESRLEAAVVKGFRALIENCEGERKIDSYLTKHPVLLTSILDLKNTGHHAAWVVPKKSIRPHVCNEMPGLIPDFLVGGKNSFGITWYVVELKGAKHKLFVESKGAIYLSSTANKGLCQVLEYMHFCNSAQAMLRNVLKLHGFVSAEGFLFIGRDAETEAGRKRDLKSAINNINSRLQIRSFDALLRCCDRILGSYQRNAITRP